MATGQTIRRNSAALVALTLALGCSANSPRNKYLLAEKLWTEGKYAAAVVEFEKIAVRDSKGKLGLQALYRAAVTQTLYLSNHVDAVKKFRVFAEEAGEVPLAWEARKQVGEILFSRLERHEEAMQHYRDLLRRRPDAPEAAEFRFRIAKASFFLSRFNEAIDVFQEIVKQHPGTPQAEQALYEIGVTHFTRGGHPAEGAPEKVMGADYREAVAAFKEFLKKHPNSRWAAEAAFGIAACHEELDQLDLAYQEYQALRASYPSPKVIEIKLHRLRERKSQRRR